MYYLYLVQSSKGRAGFGISQDPVERNKQYSSHSGDIIKFPFLYGGLRSHAKALERTIKTQYVDNLWIIDDWKTEWLADNISIDSLKEYVDELINERHFRLSLIKTDFDFTKELITKL